MYNEWYMQCVNMDKDIAHSVAYTYTHKFICIHGTYLYIHAHTVIYIYIFIYMPVYTCLRLSLSLCLPPPHRGQEIVCSLSLEMFSIGCFVGAFSAAKPRACLLESLSTYPVGGTEPHAARRWWRSATTGTPFGRWGMLNARARSLVTSGTAVAVMESRAYLDQSAKSFEPLQEWL